MIFAVDGGGTTFKTCLVDEAGDLTHVESFRVDTSRGIPGLREPLMDIFRRRLSDLEGTGHAIEAVGIGCRGVIDPVNNRLIDDPGVLKFMNGHGFDEIIETDLPMRLQNDAVAAAMGENRFGIGHDVKNFVLLTLGTGLGGGLVMDGELVRRSTEMGHFPVNPEGVRCQCGNIGCVETEFSAGAFERKIAEANKTRGPDEAIRDTRHLFELARGDDKDARAILDRGVFFLARAISGYANSLDPDRLVLSGGISLAGEFLHSMIVEALRPILWRRDPEEFVVLSKLGAQMGLYGAGAVGMDAVNGS